MKVTVRTIQVDLSNRPMLAEIPVDNIKLIDNCIMSIDGSTTNTGIAIMRVKDNAVMYSISAKRDKDDETAVHYKIKLKKLIEKLLNNNLKYINSVVYEEPIIQHVTAIAGLMMLRTSVEEVLIENDWKHIEYAEVPNMSWKRWFLQPDKIPNGTQAQKKAVYDRLITYLPIMSPVTQDECDAICMGTYVLNTLKTHGMDISSVKANKKVKPFNFEVKFMGGDSDDCLEDLFELYTGPQKLLENGLSMVELGRREKFEQCVYNTIGSEDKVGIIKFESQRHGNVVLQYKIGALAAQYEYIYAIVWRTHRK